MKRVWRLGKTTNAKQILRTYVELQNNTTSGVAQADVDLVRNELMKDFAKQVGKMKANQPRIYSLILENISIESWDEVAQEPDYKDWHNATDLEKLWQAIMKTHIVDCVSNMDQVKELTTRKVCQTMKQGPFELLGQYSERFRETYWSYKNMANAEAHLDIGEAEQAMDFSMG
jgi:hypothetical protein